MEELNHFAKDSNVISLNTEIYNEELADIHERLHTFILKEFRTLFTEEVYYHFPTLSSKNEVLFDQYFTGIGVWSILHAHINATTEESIFELFTQLNNWKFKRKKTRNTFQLWKATFPTGYEVIAVNDAYIRATDLLTKETYDVHLADKTYVVGDLIIGSLVPYVGYHCFLIDTIVLSNIKKQRLLALLQEYNPFTIGPEHFPYFLKHVLEIEHQATDVFNDDYEVVSQLITMEMHANDYEMWMITLAVSTWELFCETYQPVIKSKNTYVAAIEYYILHEYTVEAPITLQSFADMCHVPVEQLTTIYNQVKTLQADDELGGMHHLPPLYLIQPDE